MKWEKLLKGSATLRLGAGVGDTVRSEFRRLKEEAGLQAKEAQPQARPENPTMQLSADDLEIISEISRGTPEKPVEADTAVRPMQPTEELDLSLLEEIDLTAPGGTRPPPPRREAQLTEELDASMLEYLDSGAPASAAAPPGPAESGGYSLRELIARHSVPPPAPVGESSVIESLEELRRDFDAAGAESPAPAGGSGGGPAAQRQRPEESSVMASLAEIQEDFRESIAARDAGRPAESSIEANMAELLRLEAERVEAERAKADKGNGAAKGTLEELGVVLEPVRARVAESLSDISITYDPAVAVEETPSGSREISISIELVLGLPWEDEHSQYRLSGREMQSCDRDLPEREVRWVLPVPPKGSGDKAERGVLERFSGETRREFNGKEYYIVEAPFAGARRVARTGCILHIWPETSTDYDFLGEVSGETGLAQAQTGDWSINMKARMLSPEEVAEYSKLLPDRKPVFVHPVPSSQEAEAELEARLISSLHCWRLPKISVGRKDYFVFGVESVAEWHELAFTFPKARLASRSGEWFGVWPEAESGGALMSHEYGFERVHHGERGPPLLPRGGMVEPYGTELGSIARLYRASGGKRWLYPLTEKIGEMDSDTLNFLLTVSAREIELTGITPLVSLQGRWYIGLQYTHPEARESMLEDGRVRVLPLKATIKDSLAKGGDEKAEAKEPEKPVIVLPPGMEQRKPLLDMFPEGEKRYLYYVDPKNRGYIAMKPHVALMRDGEKEIYLVLKERYEGSIEVVRRGIAIYPTEG